MDEEENFARLLSESTPAPRPSLFANESDPWANPFGGDDLSGGWGGSSTAPAQDTSSSPPQTATTSAYDGGFGSGMGTVPDPPSVIHAREREELAAFGGGFGGEDYSSNPFSSSPPRFPQPTSPKGRSPRSPSSPTALRRSAPSSPTSETAARQRTLPAGLIDEDLLAEHDPEASLKRAFVKSSAPAKDDEKPVTVVPPTPEKKAPYIFKPGSKEEKKPAAAAEHKPQDRQALAVAAAAGSLPLPESSLPTPTQSRPDTPAGAGSPPADNVAVSPLDAAAPDSDYGFRSLAIGGASTDGPLSSTGARFGGRGWGAVDDEPLSTGGDPWNEGGAGASSGWGEPGPLATQSSAASVNDTDVEAENVQSPSSPARRDSATGSPRRSKLLSTPVFQITVSDPTKIGDPVRGHVVYTVRTKTTSPHYRRGDFSVLRRFSDFLWLYDQLTANNPGVIVPPVPDKHAFGRFQEQFIETRRAALQRCLGKITAHPILQLDPDLRLFLESDSFAIDVKNRRGAGGETPSTPSGGLLSSWTGPRYVEQDDWFDQRKAYLDHLEGHLKALSKSLDTASKARLDMATAMGEVAEAAQALADSELGAAMCAALGRLADLARREKGAGEAQATADVSQLLNLADEYVRFIASVRLAFASRVRAYHAWQAALKEVTRIRQLRDKARLQGKANAPGGISASEQAEVSVRAPNRSLLLSLSNLLSAVIPEQPTCPPPADTR